MSTNEERVRELIVQQAADWFVANRAGLPVQEREAFATWLTASPVHVEEYLTLSVIARELRQASAASADSVDAIVVRARAADDTGIRPLSTRVLVALTELLSSRWQTAAVAVAVVGVVCFGLLLMWNIRPLTPLAPSTPPSALHFETRHGEQQTYRLADNSVLHLNTDSAVTVRYSSIQRLVVLTSGEAEFEVTHEPKRTFRVLAGSAEVVDRGTKFDVRLRADSTVVTVVEGRVAIGLTSTSADQTRRFVSLGANQQLSVAADQWPATPIAVDAQQSTAWMQRQIVFDHEPLEAVAAEFNRYAPKPIEIATPALRNLEISGVFATDDTDAFIAFLRTVKGVRIEVTATHIRVSQD